MTIPREHLRAAVGIVAIVGCLATGLSPTVAFGAPNALDCRNVGISAPIPGAVLSGAAEIRGRALVLDFQFFKVEYAPAGEDEWVLIGTDVTRTPVENGRLVVWQTGRVPNGVYQLRLRVVDPTGNYCEAIVAPVRIANTRPVPVTVEATATETVELTVVPPQATPTIPVIIPYEVAPRTDTPNNLPPRGGANLFGMPDLFVTGAFFLFGVCGMLGIVIAVAIVIFVRRMIS